MRGQPFNWDNLAADQFRRAIAIDPEFAEAHAELAFALMQVRDREWHLKEQPRRMRKLAEAEAVIEIALQLAPGLARVHTARGALLLHKGDRAEAVAALRRALSMDPNTPDNAWLLLSAAGESRPGEGWELLQDITRSDPLHPWTNIDLAWGHAVRGDHGEADRTFRRLLSVQQPGEQVYLHSRPHFANTGRFAEANQIAKRFLGEAVHTTGSDLAVNLLAETYAWVGMWPQAAFWRAWKNDEVIDVHDYAEVVALEPEGRFQDVVNHYDRLMAREGRSVADLNLRFAGVYGRMLALTGRFSETIEVLEPVLDPGITPPDIVLWGDPREALIYAYQQSGAWNKAQPFLDQLAQKWKHLEEAGRLHYAKDLFDYSRFTLLTGDLDRAVGLLQRAYDAGWRGYYWIVHDPRWEPLRGDPRFEQIMRSSEAHVEAERREIERIDAQDGFQDHLNAAMALRARAGVAQE
jgi:tetratricopeptide (TPR) repeat protein